MRLIGLFILTLSIIGCSYPHWYFDSFKIHASFNEDGSCSFSVDGTTLSTDVYRQEILSPDHCVGCVAEHLTEYTVFCQKPYIKGDYELPPVLIMSIVISKNENLENEMYQISEVGGRVNNATTIASILSHPEYNFGGWENGLTGANLVAVEGTLNLSKVSVHSGSGLSLPSQI